MRSKKNRAIKKNALNLALVEVVQLLPFTGALAGLPPWLNGTLGVALGLVIGSFLGTLVERWPRGESAAGVSRSRCDSCGRSLRWFELLPVISYTALLGRCRSCGAAIAPRQLVIELLCGLAGAGFFVWNNPALALLVWLLIALAFFDSYHLWLPNPLVIALAAAAILAPPLQAETSYFARLVGGAAGFASLWSIAKTYRVVRHREGLGQGDAKLFGALGLWTGGTALPTLMLLACAIGLFDAVRRLKAGADAGTLRLPLGTYLAIAAIALAFFQIWTGMKHNPA